MISHWKKPSDHDKIADLMLTLFDFPVPSDTIMTQVRSKYNRKMDIFLSKITIEFTTRTGFPDQIAGSDWTGLDFGNLDPDKALDLIK